MYTVIQNYIYIVPCAFREIFLKVGAHGGCFSSEGQAGGRAVGQKGETRRCSGLVPGRATPARREEACLALKPRGQWAR